MPVSLIFPITVEAINSNAVTRVLENKLLPKIQYADSLVSLKKKNRIFSNIPIESSPAM